MKNEPDILITIFDPIQRYKNIYIFHKVEKNLVLVVIWK